MSDTPPEKDNAFDQDLLHFEQTPRLDKGRMILGLSGWMDGGDVSTGTVEWLIEQSAAEPVVQINPEPFYVYNFPGSMEVAALFRPHTKIEDGTVQIFEPPANTVYWAPEHNLLLLTGKEPHLCWPTYADCVFEIARRCGVEELYFVGSVAGVVPHTREPRLKGAGSEPIVRESLQQAGLGMSEYEGPASFTVQLLHEAPEVDLRMASLVAEIPAYIQGRNPKGIAAALGKLALLLDMQLDLDALRKLGDRWEKRIDEAVQERQDLAEHIHKLEEDYDHEVFDTMSDLKDWLEQQGIELD